MATSNPAPDVVVIGGGIIGCALAYDLARQGVSVELLERQRLAREASWASGGIVMMFPWPSDEPLTELALLAGRRYPTLIQEIEASSGMAVGWNLTGETVVAEADEASLRASMRWHVAQGTSIEWLDRQALRQREPALHARFTGGYFAPAVASVRLHQVALALAHAAASYGAVIREYTPAIGIETVGDRATGVRTIERTRAAGTVIVAAGAWSGMFGADLDVAILTMPVRGQMLAIADPPLPVTSILNGNGIYAVPRADGTISVGATQEPEAGFAKEVTPAGIRWLTDRLAGLAPSLLDGRLVATWAGLRPVNPDGLPLIGPVPHLSNVWIVTGHAYVGATLAPATSELVAASIVSGTLDERLLAFVPGRLPELRSIPLKQGAVGK